MGLGAAEFVSCALPSLVVALLMYIIFSWCRTRFPDVYEPRTKRAQPEVEQLAMPLPKGFCGWLGPLLRVDDDGLQRLAGTDVAARAIFLRAMVQIFAAISVLCCAVLIPSYSTADVGMEQFDKISMSNAEDKSWTLWFAAGLLWAATIIVFYAIYRALTTLSRLRDESERSLCHARHFVGLALDVPKESQTVEAVRQHFDKEFPGQVLFVRPVKDMGKEHEKNFAKYVTNWRAWKNAEAALEADPDKTPMTKDGFMGLCGKKVEAIPFYKEKCSELRGSIESRRKEFDSIDCGGYFFVAFRTLAASSDAIKRKEWGCVPSPDVREIYWPNMWAGKGKGARSTLFFVAALIALFITLIFIPFSAFAQSLVNLQELSNKFDWLSWVQDLPDSVLGLIQGLLPTLVVIILQALVIPIFTALAGLACALDAKSMHRFVMFKYFWFLVVTGFLAIVASSSLLNKLEEITDDPSSMASYLGESVPKASTFFMLLAMSRALGGAPMKIALLANVVLSRIFLKFAKTEYEREEALDPSYFMVGPEYGLDLFMFVTCASYAVIAPLVACFGLLYFALTLVSSKYVTAYVNRTEFDSGGMIAAAAFRGVLIAMIIAQVLVVCCISLKESFGFFLVVPLPIVTLIATVFLSRREPGSRLCRQDLPEGLISELQPKHAEKGTLEKLMQAEARGDWAQPSVSVDLDYPVRERFSWRELGNVDNAGKETTGGAKQGLVKE